MAAVIPLIVSLTTPTVSLACTTRSVEGPVISTSGEGDMICVIGGVLSRTFVQVPRVAQASLPAPEDPGVRRTEPPTPLPNRLVGHGDAPLSEEISGIAVAQTETVVEPNGVTDDLRRESVAVIADGVADHRFALPAVAST